MNTLLNVFSMDFQVYSGTTHVAVFWTFVVLTVGIWLCCLATPVSRYIFENVRGEYDRNRMRRMFMFNWQPYALILYCTLAVFVAASMSIGLLFAVGGIGYLLLWVAKLLLWAIIIIGWIGAIFGVLALFAKEPVGCLPIIIGGFIIYYQDTLSDWGETCVEAGFNFYSSLNIWDYGCFLFNAYALVLAKWAAIPIAIGFAAAIIVFASVGIIWVIETIMTRKYNIKHPCPFCHAPSEPARYLSENIELPVKLRPGMFGVFHIKHPKTGERMPTMIFNGRDELMRKCPNCGATISYKTGVEKHIAFVGLPESGKTCLTYRFVGNMMKSYPDISFTDEVNKEAQRIITDIKEGKEQELASKTSVNDVRRSLQILVPGKLPFPYHFFISDVGGELFTTSGVESSHMQFFKDVESVSILLDPYTMDFSEYELKGQFADWYKKNIVNKNLDTHSEKLSNVLNTVKTMSDQFIHKTDEIHVNIVLVKADKGYISKDVIGDEEKLKEIVVDQMGFAAEVNDLENTYASLHFYAVSALNNIGIDRLTSGIIEDLNIKL